MMFLKQSTASQSVKIGPFVDSTDAITAETALSIANTDIKLSKAGGTIGNKNSGGGTHDASGWYTITLDATDTATVGTLQLAVSVTGALPVWHEFHVLEEAVYDNLFAASAVGPLTAAGTRSAVGLASANLDTQLTAIDDYIDTEVGAIKAVTDNLPNGGTLSSITTALTTIDDFLDTEIAAIKTVTDAIGATGTGLTAIPWNAAWDAEVQSEVNDGLVAFFTSAATLVDLVWDEATSGHTTAGTTGKAVADASSGSSPSAIADAVWDEVLSGHLTGGSTGASLNAAGSAGDPWTTTLPGSYTGSQAGKMLSDILTDTAAMLTTSQIAGAVWNADTSTYNAADSFGALVNLLSVASFADAVWDDLSADHVTPGTLGAAIASILDDTGTAGVVVASGSKTGYSLTATTGLGNQTANITGNLSGSVGSVTGGINTGSGVITTLDALDTAQDVQHATTHGYVDDIGIAGVGLTNIGGLSTTARSHVNAEVVDALAADTYAEPGQGAPAATASLAAKINYLYKAWRNKKTQTATALNVFADDGTTVDQKSTVSDDGTTATVGEIASGP